MTDDACLFAAILAAPLDDAPRLALADWYDLDARPPQPERAEFVRVGCELVRIKNSGVRLDHSPYRGKVAALRRREAELLDAHCSDWFRVPGLGEFVGFGEDEPLCWWPAGDSRGEGWVMQGTPRRGFLDSVTIRQTAAFVGGPCERCEGRVLRGPGYDDSAFNDPCPACDNTGRTTGLAGVLASTAPIVSVTLSDREPWRGGDGRFYYWYREGEDSYSNLRPAAQLPGEVFELLPVRDDWSGHGPVGWTSAEISQSKLSAACIAYARSRAPGFTHEVVCPRCKGDTRARLNEHNLRTGSKRVLRNKHDGTCPDCKGTGRLTRPGLPALPLTEPRPAPAVIEGA